MSSGWPWDGLRGVFRSHPLGIISTDKVILLVYSISRIKKEAESKVLCQKLLHPALSTDVNSGLQIIHLTNSRSTFSSIYNI